jgi:hypothetical protein
MEDSIELVQVLQHLDHHTPEDWPAPDDWRLAVHVGRIREMHKRLVEEICLNPHIQPGDNREAAIANVIESLEQCLWALVQNND